MNLQQAVSQIEYNPDWTVYARDFYPEAEAVIGRTGHEPGDPALVRFADGVTCGDYVRHWIGEDGDLGDADQVSEAIDAMCATWREVYGTPSAQPADGAGLGKLFIAPGVTLASIARMDIDTVTLQVAELRAENGGDVIPLSNAQIARRILTHARQAAAHPGYIPDDELNKTDDCGCRPGHWCAHHRHQAAVDAAHRG